MRRKLALTFDLIAVLRDLNQTYHKKAAEKDIRYQVARDKDTIRHPFVIGNPVHLSRILSNITDNAIKFSPPGSAITVWSGEEQLDEEHALVTFVCRDQGIGMSEEFAAHAFDMFTQEKVTSRSTYQGTGLGLAIVKQLVDRMGGSVTLQSRPGAGTTVTVKLPFKIGKQDDLKPAAQVKGDISFKGLRALVVEDNELNMEIACCMLENSGMEVTRAADGQEAVELFEKSAPGCFGVIYMDIMMPRMNGWDAARTIRAMNRPDAEIIPIIAMSANAFCRGYYGQPSGGHGYSPSQTAGRSQDDQRLKAVHRRTECRKAAKRFVTLAAANLIKQQEHCNVQQCSCVLCRSLLRMRVSLYIITCVLTRVMNGAILSKLELQKKPRKPHEMANMDDYFDVVIVGTGAAGLYCALNLPARYRILLLTKQKADESDSFLAQGGICMQHGEADYRPFFDDTMRAGHYENNPATVDLMIRSSNSIIRDLVRRGVSFARDDHGALRFTREGAHSRPRILFHEDITGHEITQTLLNEVLRCENIELREHTTLLDFFADASACGGVIAAGPDGEPRAIGAGAVVLACGGIGGLYKKLHQLLPTSRGNAIAMARAPRRCL